MSGMFGRFTNIVKAKMHRAMSEAEDPAEMLDYSFEKQMEMLQKVRRGIAEVATSKARIQGQLARLMDQSGRLDGQARQALTLGREDLARTALARKQTIETQARALAAQVEDLEAQQNRLLDGEARLSAKIDAFRTHKEVMKAQYSAAQAQVRISETASGLSEEMGDVQLAMQRAQDKTEQMQARATALEELVGSSALPEIGPGSGDDIDRELARLSAGDDVERQLEAMKRALPGGPEAPKQLESGESSTHDEGPWSSGGCAMIVRIQGSGQYRLDDAAQSELASIDARLVAALERGAADEAHTLLGQAVSLVQTHGAALPDDALSPSDLILPPADASLDEISIPLHPAPTQAPSSQ